MRYFTHFWRRRPVTNLYVRACKIERITQHSVGILFVDVELVTNTAFGKVYCTLLCAGLFYLWIEAKSKNAKTSVRQDYFAKLTFQSELNQIVVDIQTLWEKNHQYNEYQVKSLFSDGHVAVKNQKQRIYMNDVTQRHLATNFCCAILLLLIIGSSTTHANTCGQQQQHRLHFWAVYFDTVLQLFTTLRSSWPRTMIFRSLLELTTPLAHCARLGLELQRRFWSCSLLYLMLPTTTNSLGTYFKNKNERTPRG